MVQRESTYVSCIYKAWVQNFEPQNKTNKMSIYANIMDKMVFSEDV